MVGVTTRGVIAAALLACLLAGLGIRGDVTATVSESGRESGLGSVPAGIGFAFNSSFVNGSERIRARNARGRVLASFLLRHS